MNAWGIVFYMLRLNRNRGGDTHESVEDAFDREAYKCACALLKHAKRKRIIKERFHNTLEVFYCGLLRNFSHDELDELYVNSHLGRLHNIFVLKTDELINASSKYLYLVGWKSHVFDDYKTS